jgi:alpha-beta hydrolase superfamily lysophospholipase
MERISLTTSDGITLSALLWNKGVPVSVLLIHMMPATKESWQELGDRLAEKGINVLAIDLRGHGESGGGDYRQFQPEQHYGYFKDQEAAIGYLQSKFPHTELCLGGASIGANMTIKYMAEHHDVPKGFALSPGLDYYGVRAVDDVKKLDLSQKLLIVGSHDDLGQDGDNRGQQAQQLYELTVGRKDKVIYDSGGHGTTLFSPHPELYDKITEFLIN